MEHLSFGCQDSEHDVRTVVSTELAFADVLAPHGKVNMEQPSTQDLCNQRRLGICTACSVRNGAEHHFKDGVRLSEYWLYLIQKTKIDGNLTEGSSIFSGLKVSKTFGIPTKDIELLYPLNVAGSYAEFIQGFNREYGGVVPQAVLDNASMHKIVGYYSVPVDPISIAKEIQKDHVVMTRFTVGENTYTPSWRPEDLFPLRPPTHIDGGHAWTVTEYDGLDEQAKQYGLNSWSRNWGSNGYFNFIFKTQKPYFTEAWAISDEVLPPKPFVFNNNLSFGMKHPDVVQLQKFLNTHGFQVASQGAGSPGNETQNFGSCTKLAVIKFQLANNIKPAIGNVFELTRAKINSLI